MLCIPGELKKQLKVLSLEVITPKREVLLKNVKKKEEEKKQQTETVRWLLNQSNVK